MKNKIFLLLLVLVLGVLFAGCARNPAPTVEDPQHITLDFATFWPATDFQVAEGHKAWAEAVIKRVDEETPHAIDFQWHYGGSLLTMPELWPGVVAGAADIVTTAPVYTPGVFPLAGVFELPFFKNDNALVASMTVWDAYKQSEDLHAEFADAKILFFWATGPGDIINNTPIRRMEDLAGLELRAIGGSGPAFSHLGGTPVAFGMGQSYEKISAGVVDGLIAPTDTLKGFRLAEVTRYITKTPFIYNIVFVKAMSWDTWEALPPSVQKILDEVNEEYVSVYGKLRTIHTKLGQEFGVKEHGMEVIELEAAEYERWMAKVRPMVEGWITATNAKGLSGQQTFDLVRDVDAGNSEKYGSFSQ